MNRHHIKFVTAVFSILALAGALHAAAPACAYADGGDTTGTAACGNGWVLSYSANEELARITGVETPGSGTLAIPDTLGGKPVKVIGACAFKDCDALTSVEIPDTVEVLKSDAFMSTEKTSPLTSIVIPASVKAIPRRCFWGCAQLKDVRFEGKSLLYLGQMAFMHCASIEEITLPYLTSYPVQKDDANTIDQAGYETYAETCSIGKSCFAKCSSLATITFDGMVEHGTPDYFLDISNFNGCFKLSVFIWKCRKDSVNSGTGGNKQFTLTDQYYTLDFYASETDAANLENRLASVTYRPKLATDIHNMVKTLDLIYKRADYSAYKLAGCTDEIPDCPAGKVWGVADQSSQAFGAFDTLDNSYQVVAVDPDDLRYGWTYSPEMNRYYSNVETSGSTGSMYDSTYPVIYMEEDGSVPDLDELAICSADGSVLSGDQYAIAYEKTLLRLSNNGRSYEVVGWEEVDEVQGAGRYHLQVTNTDNGTSAPQVTFEVRAFTPDVHDYTNYTYINALGALSADAGRFLLDSEGNTSTVYDVVVPCSDWRFQLIGASLAGAGGGLLLFDDASKVPSTDAYRAHQLTACDSVQIVGSTATVPQSVDVTDNVYLADWLLSTLKGDQTRYRSDETAQALAAQVYKVMCGDYWQAAWGKTAIVVSSESAVRTLPIAQLAYEERAPMFFAGGNGALASDDLALLASGEFERIVVAGDATQVSDACVSSIARATGVTPERVLDAKGSAFTASLAWAQSLVAEGEHSYDCVAVADGTSSANIVEAAQIAALGHGVVLVCSSSEDVKRAQAFLRTLITEGASSTVKSLYLSGTFEKLDAAAGTRLASIWTTPVSSTVTSADSFEIDGCIYRLSGASSASLVDRLETAGSAVNADKVTFRGRSYPVSSIAASVLGSHVKSLSLGAGFSKLDASAIAACPNLESLSISSTKVTSIPASCFAGMKSLRSVNCAAIATLGTSAFQGCSSLSAVALGSSVKTVGAKAFSACKKLKTLNVGAKLTGIGDAAFQGCTALTALKAGTKVATVGASAFSGCSALKSVSFGASVKTLGASAFQGCKKLSSIAFGKPLARIGAKAFSGCKALKGLTVKSTKLSDKKVGAKAFSQMPAKAKVKVPKTKLKAYKKLFVKRGLSKKASFKKC